MSRTPYYFFLFVVLIGIADAGYLALSHYFNIPPVCGSLHGCEVVSESSYSILLGVHLSYIGVAYYLGAAFLSSLFASRSIAIIVAYTGLGALMSLWFLYIQGSLIGAWCIYCVISALCTFLLFGVSILGFKKK